MEGSEETSKAFYKTFNDNSDRLISWVTTWQIGIVKESHLMILLEKALPYKVIINKQNYEEMNNWIETNSTGYWTHINIHFYFEFEEDAIAFKLKWI